MADEKFSFAKQYRDIKATLRTAGRILGLLWQIDRLIFVGSLITSVVPGVLPFVNAYIYKLVIDLIVKAVASGTFDTHHLLFLIFLRFLVYVAQNILSRLDDVLGQLVWIKFPTEFYQMVLGKISSLDLEHFENSVFKDRLNKVRDSYTHRPENMLSACFDWFQSAFTFLVAFVLIIKLSWVLAIIILFTALPSFFNQIFNAKRVWSIWDKNSAYRKRFYYLADLLQNSHDVKEVKMFAVAPRFLAEIRKTFSDFFEESFVLIKKQFKVSMIFNVISIVFSVGVEGFVIFLAARGKITVGDITYYSSVLLGFMGATTGLFRNVSRIFDNGLYVREIFAVLDTEPKIVSPRNAVKPSFATPPTIEFRNVSFSYPGATAKVYDDFSLTIAAGERIAFVGENGAGKTTFVKLLARFYDVDHGAILIDGVNIKDLDLENWHRALGVLFQDFVRYEYPVKDNISFGNVFGSDSASDVKHAAELSGADAFISKLEHGYDQMLGKTFDRGTDLSTGQWQKIALGRAFFRNAPVLILDEPTAAIDAKAESEIFERVESLSKGKTTIIISHRFSTVKSADRICVVDAGRIIESGSHTALMKKKGTYATLFNLQAKAYK